MTKLLFFLFLFLTSVIWHPASALAACASPTGAAGDVYYNTDQRVMQYCNNSVWVSAGPNLYNPVAVTFDGTNDYLTRGADLSSNGDGLAATGSFWIRRNGGLGTKQVIYSNTGPRFEISLDTSNQVRLEGGNASANNRLVAFATSPAITDTNWHHVMFSFDTTGGNCANGDSIYIDGTAATVTWSTCDATNNIDFTVANHSIGALVGGTVKLNADLADLWLEFRAYYDLSTNGGLFIKNSRPVYLGSAGASGPTGAAPDIFLSGTLSSWETNDGSGGGFTENGALTAGATPVETGSGGTSVSSGLVGWWKLNESAGATTAVDSSGNGNSGTKGGSTSGAGGDFIAAQVNNGFDFETGNSNYFTIGDVAPLKITGSQTFMAWFKLESLWSGGNDDYIVTKSNSGPQKSWEFKGSEDCGTERLQIDLSTTGANSIQRCSATTLNTATWYHGAAVYDASAQTLHVYLNGNLDDSTLTGVVPASIFNSTTGVYIGSANSAIPFDGIIDDVRIYNRALSGAEILQIYQMYDTGCSGPVGGQGDLTYNTTTHAMQYCEGRNWRPMGKAPGTGGAGCSNPAGSEADLYYNTSFNVLQYCDGASWRQVGSIPTGPTSGLVGWWKLDESAGPTATDSSASGNNGTYANSPTPTTGTSGNALDFSGDTGVQANNDRVDIGDPGSGVLDFGAGSFSYGLWVYVTATAGNWDMPWHKGGSSAPGTGYDMELGASNWAAWISDGSNIYGANFSASPMLNQWVHLFVVVDRPQALISTYVNGAASGFTTAIPGGFGSTSSTAQATIGSQGAPAGAGQNPFLGKIDDMRVYNRALTAGEIQQLYYATGGQ